MRLKRFLCKQQGIAPEADKCLYDVYAFSMYGVDPLEKLEGMRVRKNEEYTL